MQPSVLRTLGVITAVQGLKGSVLVKPYSPDNTAWADVLDQVIVFHKSGPKPYRILSSRPIKNQLVIAFEGITSRDEAMNLIGFEIKALESDLPPLEEDEYYLEALAGLAVFSELTQERLGKITDILSSDAGDFIEVQPDNIAMSSVLVPFQQAFVGHIDLQKKQLFIRKLDSFFEAPSL
jgi:16S rRNA processing protein RimM